MGEPTDTPPRIYVACLAAYNNGILHGVWIDADQPEDSDIRDEIRAMLKASPIAGSDEYAIHDHEGFGGLEVSEYEGVDDVRRLAAFVAEHGSLGVEVARYFGGDIEEAHETLEDHYAGPYARLADFMEELQGETIAIPEALRYYIDWEAMGRDAEMSGELFTIQTAHDEVHVFWSR